MRHDGNPARVQFIPEFFRAVWDSLTRIHMAPTTTAHSSPLPRLQALHWPEYFMEAACLGLFLLSACIFGTLLEHPSSQVHLAIEAPLARRALMGLAMGTTAIVLICSPFGRRSGAHLNPCVTLTYWMLGKIARRDALLYVGFQFLGGAAGVALAHFLVGPPLEHGAVLFVVTEPGPSGVWPALAAEFAISLMLMLTVLQVSNSKALSRYTPFFAGALVALFITFEAPISGMSMNPARTFASAYAAGQWENTWIYFVGPPSGMFLAAALYRFRSGAHRVFCAKLHHHHSESCIFRCNYSELK
jgi:aquaporin Z